MSNADEQRTVRNILDDLRLVEQVFKEDRIAEAYILLRNIEKMIPDLGQGAQNTVTSHIENSSVITELRRKGSEIMDILDLVRNKTSWNAWNSKLGPHQDVSLFLHINEPEGQYHFKTEGYLRNVNIIDAAAAILENDLYRYWIPTCTASKTVDILTAHQRVIQTKFDFVLLKKTATMEVRGDVLPDGALLLTFQPLVRHGEEGKSLPKNNAKDSMDLKGAILLQDIDIIEEVPRNEFQDLIDYVQNRRQEVPGHISDANRRHSHIGEMKDDESLSSRLSADAGRLSSHSSVDDDNIEKRNDDDELEGFEGNDNRSSFQTPIKSPAKAASGATPASPWSVAEQEELGILPRPASKTAVVKVQAVFMADLKIDFIPDWIFNLGMRSTASMFIPMLEQQALLFAPNGLHQEEKRTHAALYQVIESRIADYTKGK